MWVFAHLGLLDFSQGKKDPHAYAWQWMISGFIQALKDQKREEYKRSW